MTKKRTLAIMAAGLGTRFGSLKQLYNINNEGNSIMDYSIFDAVKVGFNEIIIIVNEATLTLFRNRYPKNLIPSVSIHLVVQNDNTNKYHKREKPFGTGHALLKLKSKIENNFVLINADDFYGREAFQTMFNSLFNKETNNHYFIGYQLKKTLSKNGFVSRGECILDAKNNLKTIIERTKIIEEKGEIYYLNEKNLKIAIHPNTVVSMNFWGFNPEIFEFAESCFNVFLKNEDNILNNEFYITTIVNSYINSVSSCFKMLPTQSTWHGITYKKDVEDITNSIDNLTSKSIYPTKLW
ncbi:sugar phosphate nucleotidyltransferase [Lacinutrix chionoecetis]